MTEPEPKITGSKLLDIGLGWLLTYEHSSHWLDFKAYQVAGKTVGSRGPGMELPGEVLYQDKNCQFVSDLALAEPDFTGYVKWDGCCEIEVDIHVCGTQGLANLVMAMGEAHKLCLLLPNVDPACAGYSS